MTAIAARFSNLTPFKIAAMFAAAVMLAELVVAFGLEVWFY